ncbi:hypothetical protein Q4Q39_16895 [Flavivirga amylovorans]|uniref:Leucine-rich repeat domain-containing protein n=1 Tax=Flavivirga amylovorans TaxID=870486 RepID=A0ABT8X5A3_9FLAO|nr:hypothetical protein [Flavivirga amylovorans]MDO5989084.1 hypothetical protein [Flavivirga amylovorans]
MKILKHLTLIFTLILFTSCSNDDDGNKSNGTELKKDRDALIEIYNANTNNTLTWDISTIDVSTWDGITVENNRVSAVNIGKKNIDNLPVTAMQQLTDLRSFFANENSIVSINLEKNTKLKRLGLFVNQIQTIDVSTNILLEQLLLEHNNLQALDISKLIKLTDLKAHSNNLTGTINIANGNNSNMLRMQLQGNANLTCIKVDQGAVNGFSGWKKTPNSNYNINCIN